MSLETFIAPPLSSEFHGGFDAPTAVDEALLWAGDITATRIPMRMSTVLGSCVSVCLFDTVHHFGGMNHFLVPRGGKSPMHGDWATQELIDRMCALGSTLSSLEAKIFGGGMSLRVLNNSFTIAAENIAIARQVLAAAGIPITAERVGLPSMRLFFDSWTGVVWVRAK